MLFSQFCQYQGDAIRPELSSPAPFRIHGGSPERNRAVVVVVAGRFFSFLIQDDISKTENNNSEGSNSEGSNSDRSSSDSSNSDSSDSSNRDRSESSSRVIPCEKSEKNTTNFFLDF